MKKVVIIGGGLAGIIAGIRLQRSGIPCLVVEKKIYPFHRVCGEYISNECKNFLKSENLFPSQYNPPNIDHFQLTSTTGKSVTLPLDLGGFGISRYSFDNFLYENALREGVEFITEKEVVDVSWKGESFVVKTEDNEIESKIVIGSFGKRSRIDVTKNRSFTKKRSPYVGIKYHIRTEHLSNLITLHNFDGGYCGISNVENGITNLCYLVHRDVLKAHKNIPGLEQAVLCRNPHLKKIFNSAEFLFESPETINEISFQTKEPVWNHVLMAGDSAGMIAPLCGNGMAMAIHGGKMVADLITSHLGKEKFIRQEMEHEYTRIWNNTFSSRLRFGRFVQHYLFGSAWSSRLSATLAINSRFIANAIIRKTHGESF